MNSPMPALETPLVAPHVRLSVVISAYNEEEALPLLFSELLEELRGWTSLEVIIVNDGSLDQTAEVMERLKGSAELAARPEVRLVLCSLDSNQGMGAALQAGYRLASEPWVTFLPGDGQIAPAMIPPLCDAVKRGAIFVNVARGSSVVTDDLVDALADGRIAGAGLDVTDPEPLPPDHRLWRMPNVIITPHIAWYGNNRERRLALARENIRRFIAGDALLNVVDPARGY